MDINDNVQPLDGHCFQDKMQRKKDADGFPNFDMWNSVLPPLPNSPTSSSASPKVYDESPLLDQAPNKSARDWENGTVYPPSQLPLPSNQYQHDSGVSNYHSYCFNALPNKIVGQTRPIAAVRYQNPSNMLLQPPAYLYSKDVVAYPPSSSVARHDCRSHGRNEQIGARESIADTDLRPVGERLDDYLCHGGISTKTGNAIARPAKPAASCVQNCSSNLLNFAPICTSAENATSCLVPFNMANRTDERRRRPILKPETTHIQL